MQKSIGIVFILLLFGAFLISCSSGEKQEAAQQETVQQADTTMQHQMGEMSHGELAADEAIDPVCGMKIKKADAAHTYEFQGKTYYFCMKADYDAFVANPEKYVNKG